MFDTGSSTGEISGHSKVMTSIIFFQKVTERHTGDKRSLH